MAHWGVYLLGRGHLNDKKQTMIRKKEKKTKKTAIKVFEHNL